MYEMLINVCQRLKVTTCINILNNTVLICLTFLILVALIDVESYFGVLKIPKANSA
jgi:hypothetical protein